MSIFEQKESAVRSYCRNFTGVFETAKGSVLTDEEGHEYLDFFAGAGALNYGHNNPAIMTPIVEYIQKSGVTHALDMHTAAKRDFMETFEKKILEPRGLDYKFMFCGPTGANSVEAAAKLARKVKGRANLFAFSGAFHGMTLGSLSMTSGDFARAGAGVPLNNVTFMPWPSGFNASFDTIGYIENVLTADHSGVEKPAAIFLETVQAEGGINIADVKWLQDLRALCDRHDILMVCDDIQVGCGRTGTFFSFERAGIVPDMVTLSKSISGSGLPMSLLLFRPELDAFAPGEHNGTFRGNQFAFVGAKAAIDYLEQSDLLSHVKECETLLREQIEEKILPLDSRITQRGIGMIHGIDFSACGIENPAVRIERACYARGLIIEVAGRRDEVLKILPPLTTTREELVRSMDIIREATIAVLNEG